jgi:hypothetical protein
MKDETNHPSSSFHSSFIPMPRKSFLLRVDPKLLEQLQRWADDDLRSLNGQIEFLLRKALRDAGREKEEPKDGKDAAK